MTEYTRWTDYCGENNWYLMDENNMPFAKILEPDAEQRTKLIVTAVNACKSINPQKPELVANEIENMHKALEQMARFFGKYPEFVPNWTEYSEQINHAVKITVDTLSRMEG